MWVMTEQGWRPLHKVCVNSNSVQGVFVDRTLEEVRALPNPFFKVQEDYINGVVGWQEWRNHPVHSRKEYSPIVNG